MTGINRPGGEVITYQYDSRGNRISTLGTDIDQENFIPGIFTYNSWDEMESFTAGDTSTYEYDPEGLRTVKETSEENIRYHCDDNGLVIAESDATDTVTAQNIWGHKPLARKIDGSYYYYIYNGHGDVIQVIDESGTAVNTYEYDEWGNILSQQETVDNPLKYCGEYYDDESGLYYLRARYYDPRVGRFVSQDSYEGDITNPLSLNLYSYCSNSPIVYVDPSGHWQEGDGNYSLTVQTMLLQLTIDYYLAETDEERSSIHDHANNIRELADGGWGWGLDNLKKVTEAATNEFSWFLGGSSSHFQRDEYLSYVSMFQDITINNQTYLQKGMFVVSLFTGSGESKVAIKDFRSLIGTNKTLIKCAEQAGADKFKQNQMDNLIKMFITGNKNPGIGTKNVFGDVYELRGSTGARVYFRMNDGVMEILAKSNKKNQNQVIQILKDLYGK